MERLLPCVGGPLDGKRKKWAGPNILIAPLMGRIPNSQEAIANGAPEADEVLKKTTYHAEYVYDTGLKVGIPAFWRWEEINHASAVQRLCFAYTGSTPCTT